MAKGSERYLAAERNMKIPPVSERGRTNQNPPGISFWALVAEDFRTHDRDLFSQGFWAIFVHRFGNWRMGQPKIIRAPATLLYRIMFKIVEWVCGISLWYPVKLGRRVRIWHHSGMSLGARAIGDDVHIRQNTTLGVAQTGVSDLPIVSDGADIGAGACILGAVYVGRNAKIGANALVIADVPDGATAIGNPAQLYMVASDETAESDQPDAGPADTAAARGATGEPDAERSETMLDEHLDMGTVALLGSANLDYLAMDLKETGARFGLKISPYVPPFGQARTELLKDAGDSELQRTMAEGATATLIVERAEDVLAEAITSPLTLRPEDVDAYLDDALEPMLQLLHMAREKLRGPVFVTALAKMSRSTLGLADASSERGVDALIAKANAKIAAAAAGLPDVRVLDTADIIADVGRLPADPGGFWHLGRVPFSPAFNTHLSRRVLGALLSLRGQSARILVLDLDNTLWGGVLGEDGMENLEIGGAYPGSAFRAFQQAIIALSERGIALAVVSKNDEDLALKVLAEHPEMVIRPGDLVAHRIGWNEKSLGIQEILDEVGLGAGSCMFIDDNPVEREKVRKNVPGAIVPRFPDAPEDLVRWLLDNPFIECLEITSSDIKRTAQYKARAKVTAARREFQNVEDFYRDLRMTLTFEPYGPENQKRALQLFVKTNQFNATQRRYDAGGIQKILDEGGEVFVIGVSDRHSPYELMGIIVLRPDGTFKAAHPDDKAIEGIGADGDWWVDNFLLSCRILGRTIEDAIVAWASERAASKGAARLFAEVIESPRNTPVRGVFGKAGMSRVEAPLDMGAGGIYVRDLAKEGPIPVPDYFTIGAEPPAKDETAGASSENEQPRPRTARVHEVAFLPERRKVAAPSPSTAIALNPTTETKLARIFRGLFQLESEADLSEATVDNVAAWDSLGHLRLAMEIEQGLGIRVPADALGRVRSYNDLRRMVAERAA